MDKSPWKRMIFTGLVTLVPILLVFQLIGYLDREDLHKKDAVMQRILDERTENQKILSKALARNNILTPEELAAIQANWDKAGYEK